MQIIKRSIASCALLRDALHILLYGLQFGIVTWIGHVTIKGARYICLT